MLSNCVFEAIFLAVLLIYFIKFLWNIVKMKKIPPGPIGLPFVGYLPFLTSNRHLKLLKISKKYGEIFSLKLGSQLVVVLNGTASIREALEKPEFLARPPNNSFLLLSDERPSASLDLKVWREQRAFVVRALKDLGFGSTKITQKVQREIHHFLKILESFLGSEIDPTNYLRVSMSNTLSMVILGQRYEHDDPERQIFNTRMNDAFKVFSKSLLYIFFPWLKRFLSKKTFANLKKAVENAKRCDDWLLDKIKEHKETIDPTHIRDFIDSYIIEMEKRMKKDPNTSFTDSKLIQHIILFFVAGSASVQNFVSWSLYIMAAFPEVQAKIQKEISEIIGYDRLPTVEDKRVMPYTNAVLQEIMRWKTRQLSAYRYTTTDTTLVGYNIPKNTIVVPNFSAVHLSDKYWKNPHRFIPERFLSQDKKSVVNSINFMPFSVGKRSCPAEAMAKLDIFLYVVGILQKFNIEFPAGFKPTFDADYTLEHKLKSYKLHFRSRS